MARFLSVNLSQNQLKIHGGPKTVVYRHLNNGGMSIRRSSGSYPSKFLQQLYRGASGFEITVNLGIGFKHCWIIKG